jgi:WD40 repeat protein
VRGWGGGTPGGIPPTAVWHAAFSPDGKIAVTGSREGELRRWEVKTGKLLGPATGPPYEIGALAFSRDGRTVLTGERNASTARLWNAETGQQLGPPLQHPWLPDAGIGPLDVGIWTVAFSPDGRSALTGSLDRTARVWETATGKQVGPPLQHQDPVHLAKFTPDGTTIVTGSN